MIQRIQSLFLALASLLSLLLLRGSYLTFSENTGTVIKVVFAGIIRDSAGLEPQIVEPLYLYSTLLILIPLISLIALFLYKNRKFQLWLVLSLIVFVILLLALSVYYYSLIVETYGASVKPGFMMLIPVILLVFPVLAYRGIKKDDEMVKSYDRLR
jgi:hypothetical protein